MASPEIPSYYSQSHDLNRCSSGDMTPQGLARKIVTSPGNIQSGPPAPLLRQISSQPPSNESDSGWWDLDVCSTNTSKSVTANDSATTIISYTDAENAGDIHARVNFVGSHSLAYMHNNTTKDATHDIPVICVDDWDNAEILAADQSSLGDHVRNSFATKRVSSSSSSFPPAISPLVQHVDCNRVSMALRSSEESATSMPLPRWASVYYKRGSTCLTQLAHRSALFKKYKDDSGDESESLVSGASWPLHSAAERDRIAAVAAIQQPEVSHQQRSRVRYTRRPVLKFSDPPWEIGMTQAIEAAPKTFYGEATLGNDKAALQAEANSTRRLILIFTVGFLFPPLWLLGCTLHDPSQKHKEESVLECENLTRPTSRWRMACAIMLGMFFFISIACTVFAITMTDT